MPSKIAATTFFTTGQKSRSIGITGNDTVIEKFRIVDKKAINTVAAKTHLFTIDAADPFKTGKSQIAVFRIYDGIGVFTVFIPANLPEVEMWHLTDQFSYLFKERPLRIIISAVLQRIPIIRIPTRSAIYRRRRML
ncbi:MAG: hypothetical protein A3B74_01780 [Candidatus Kerfeldbacteria bacterium RIFCSPHIGHO2_02_FULL_42_14]|uniref:Uncharacterized protein n=1 Tax=Candidatus Kerfeldbacteria bacterium RIFCSPHIGHO2_02_FULL_42_14 TaxID=1798540 RepID=A0A1G2AS65_9BACT|nr:MAG: hypothetical protein A3B74_01780 [Candidatus Kerfeldbacteria bacterium RIFCSPHIGHO2_02_FULL_42_14]OGY82243.1 MAG: hypothetical protein A3E60_00110 [Candidatus Kerfeldbacteria bacterium RIFCSPHIGHO2_12_FULL_42_13]OGY82718.1 MAG: hypothetical protein A3I91_01000 [Candidatus Kerfeldbacteria bacterium RIFCSPLOWO2_02_FULL_42_19]OGY86080.1 MAG: hypothetical protein A3G01_03195 [Candidatus Kerfeldbacteria bacterium RIFCSPLOWO2_12_FULL_43_9]